VIDSEIVRDGKETTQCNDRQRFPDRRRVPLPAIQPRVFQQTVDQADIAISITDGHGSILYVNPAFTRVTGHGAAEAIGHNESILSNRPRRPNCTNRCGRRFRNGEAWGGRLINRRKDGTKYPRRAEHLAIIDVSGEVLNYLGMHRDITEMQSARNAR